MATSEKEGRVKRNPIEPYSTAALFLHSYYSDRVITLMDNTLIEPNRCIMWLPLRIELIKNKLNVII